MSFAFQALSQYAQQLAATGAMTAALTAGATSSATLTATGAMAAATTGGAAVAATATATGAMSAPLAGSAAVSASATATGAMSGSLTGACALSATPSATGNLACAATASAALAASLTGAAPLAASLTASAAVSGSITANGDMSAALTGNGVVSATPSATGVMAAALTGSGAIAAALAGDAALSASLVASASLAGTLSGAGAMSAQLTGQALISALLSYDGQQPIGVSTWLALAQAVSSRFASLISTATVLDNSQTATPNTGPWIRLALECDAIEQIATGLTLTNTYRTEGRAVAIIHVEAESSVAAAFAIVDEITTDFRHATAGGVRYGVPTARTLGRDGSWWRVECTIPFRSDADILRINGNGGGNPTTLELMQIITSRFNTEIAQPEGVVVQLDNAQAPIANETWVRLTVLLGEQDIVGMGDTNRYRTPGVAVAQIFAPLESGPAEAFELADAVIERFRSVTDRGVTFKSPVPTVVGRRGDAFQVNVNCPFFADTFG